MAGLSIAFRPNDFLDFQVVHHEAAWRGTGISESALRRAPGQEINGTPTASSTTAALRALYNLGKVCNWKNEKMKKWKKKNFNTVILTNRKLEFKYDGEVAVWQMHLLGRELMIACRFSSFPSRRFFFYPSHFPAIPVVSNWSCSAFDFFFFFFFHLFMLSYSGKWGVETRWQEKVLVGRVLSSVICSC